MDFFLDISRQRLKQAKIRLTPQRLWVLEALATLKKPMGAYELKALLKAKGQRLDLVSVYRSLECFEKLHLIHRLPSQNKVVRCDLLKQSAALEARMPRSACSGNDLVEQHFAHGCRHEHAHLLLVCSRCGTIQESHTDSVKALFRELQETQGFYLNEQGLELIGQCKHCHDTPVAL
jgi:Fur family transcriptional regulator, zinc uptake regulator